MSIVQYAVDHYCLSNAAATSLDNGAYDDSHHDHAEDPEDVFTEIKKTRAQISSFLQSSAGQDALINDYFLDLISRVVHGSNLIEKAGSNLEVTRALCKISLETSEEDTTEDLSPQDSLYNLLKDDLFKQNRSTNEAEIQKSYHEVIQHCRALNFLISKVVTQDNPLSETLILEAHKILTYKVDSSNESYKNYGGVFRTTRVFAGFSDFTLPQYVASEMKAFIADLSADIITAEKLGQIDPFVLAAKYCHKFVNIHSFADGNGRMCRLIMNVLLFKYTGIFCVLGNDDQGVQDYLTVAVRGGEAVQVWKELDEEEAAYTPPPWGELAFMILRQTKKEMENFMSVLNNASDSGSDQSLSTA
ncbi:hypothetical protein D6D13_04222 [Aureobasidium pullulans]|uniref:Fido domain-containing protein n=1 Tax=Aureobasidium pullulans TaxID=5580 RepID=A0A4S9CX80_AURPU|nr:hypothetical protein D6D13_04222 [Aureobasidium pullulans]